MKRSFDVSIVKKAIGTDNGFNISIMRYAKKRIETLWDEGRIRSWKKYKVFYNKLVAFLEQNPEFGIKFPIRKISVQFVCRFESYLRTSPNSMDSTKILHNNTVVVNMQVLKTLVNRAISIDGLVAADKNPFLGYSLKKSTSSREHLSLEEIESIKELELEPGSIQWNARNMFLFSFYCAGIRIGDLLQLKWGNVQNRQRLVYYMDKNHKRRDIILVPDAIRILQRYRKADPLPSEYIFPFLRNESSYSSSKLGNGTLNPEMKLQLVNKICESTRRLNEGLLQVVQSAGISKHVTMHISRHTFASLARDMGVDSAHIQSILAHSSLRTTEIYMGSFNTDESDKVLINMFDSSTCRTDTTSITGGYRNYTYLLLT